MARMTEQFGPYRHMSATTSSGPLQSQDRQKRSTEAVIRNVSRIRMVGNGTKSILLLRPTVDLGSQATMGTKTEQAMRWVRIGEMKLKVMALDAITKRWHTTPS